MRTLQAALSALLITAVGCQLEPPARSGPIPVECVGVPEAACPEVGHNQIPAELQREDVERAVVTCTNECTQSEGAAHVELVLTNGQRVPITTINWPVGQ